jgi:hypothetical protein
MYKERENNFCWTASGGWKYRVWPMRYKACHQAHNAKVEMCAVFATRNSLKSQGRRKLLPPLATFVPYWKSCARGQGRQPSNPHSSSPLHRCSFPLIAVSSLGGFRTPAVVRVETFVAAGIRKPSQTRPFNDVRDDWLRIRISRTSLCGQES